MTATAPTVVAAPEVGAQLSVAIERTAVVRDSRGTAHAIQVGTASTRATTRAYSSTASVLPARVQEALGGLVGATRMLAGLLLAA